MDKKILATCQVNYPTHAEWSEDALRIRKAELESKLACKIHNPVNYEPPSELPVITTEISMEIEYIKYLLTKIR